MRIRPELRSDFEEKFRSISIPAVQAQPGFASVSIGKPTRWSPDEYVMVSVWKDEAALEGFAGRDWNRPVIPAGMEQFVVETQVHHYENF